MSELPRRQAPIKTGDERIHEAGTPVGPAIKEFWSWAFSDLLSNALRGVFAEYLVASALGIEQSTRNEWDPFDLLSDDGRPIEVKSSAYLQSWYQLDYSRISFDVSKSIGWDAETNKLDGASKRHSYAYVFCLLNHKDKDTVDPLDVSQWEFFVVPTREIDEKCGNRKSLSLSALHSLDPIKCDYATLKEAWGRVA